MEMEADLPGPLRWLPAHTPHHGEHPPSESALLDTLVYVDDRTNASTTRAVTSRGHTLTLTFWAARPPLLSYFTAHIPGLLRDGPATPLDRLPRFLRTHGDLALLRVPINSTDNDYFIYCAAGGGASRLLLLPSFPARLRSDRSIGLLRCPGQHGRYFVAALRPILSPGNYAVDLLDSESDTWTWCTRPMHTESPQEFDFGIPTNSFALPGSICWVDRAKGILICDLLNGNDNVLRFVPFPVLLAPKQTKFLGRDVGMGSDGCIRYMEVWAHPVPGSDDGVTYTSQDWGAAIARWLEPKNKWHISHQIKASDIAVDDSHSRLLPQHDVKGTTHNPTLSRLHAGHPALSLHDDDVVYIMIKVNHTDNDSWVLDVDMRNKTLKGVAALSTGSSFYYTFFPTDIFKLLGQEKRTTDATSPGGTAC